MDNMHEMDRTHRIITIIGLVLEAMGVFGLIFASFLFKTVFTEDFFVQLDPNIDLNEVQSILDIYSVLANVFIVMAIVVGIIVVVNLYLFIKLIRGKFDEKQAKRVYTYQFIWGILSVLSNTLTGILYIISGYQGMKGITETRDIREGI